MTKDQMTALLGSAGVTQEIITAMEQAYEMGFEHGAKAGEILRSAVEAARTVCEHLDMDRDEAAKDHTSLFWDAVERLRALE